MSKRKLPRAIKPEPVKLEARQTIVQAADLHRTLLARLAGGGPIAVDGADVEEIDTSILQLLVSFWQSSRARGAPCSWHGTSDALCRTANLLGLACALQLPETGSAQRRGDARP